jgi:antitoxin HicB
MLGMLRRIPLLFTPQPEGGFVVTSPMLAEWVIKGDSLKEVDAHGPDALAAVIELYSEQGRTLPPATALPTAV